jgi:hypothetical protein
MGLFTDRGISTSEDLRAYESSVLDVASTEGIELDAKLNLAVREIASELSAYLVKRNPEAAGNRDLSGVVVTDALADWHRVLTLSLIYRDAYNSQNNDRYLGKWKEYAALATKASAVYLEIGVGITSQPIPKPAAPICTRVNGGTLAAAVYAVQLAWQNARGEFGALSDLLNIDMPAGTLLSVTPSDSPAAAVSWSVFVGRSPTDLSRQNITPIVRGDSWVMPIAGLQSGAPFGSSQVPDYYILRDRQFRRG